jgi:hypothetical protein
MLRRSPREVQRLKSTDVFRQLQLEQVRLAESVLGSWLDDEEAMNNFCNQEVDARSLYISSNAIAESTRISKTRSQPARATVAWRCTEGQCAFQQTGGDRFHDSAARPPLRARYIVEGAVYVMGIDLV